MTHCGQRGVALISVLLITSLALLVVAGLMRSHRLALQGTAQQLQQLQMRQAALTAESRAAQLLQAADLQEARTVNFSQDWANKAEAHELPDLELQVRIEDLGGRFNLTRLVATDNVDEVAQQRWARLLEALGIPLIDPIALKGITLTDPAQLQRLPGVRKEDLKRLLPWVAVLPYEASLNVNTAPAPVLAALEGMTLSSARGLVSQRPAQGYSDTEAFTHAPGVQGLGVSTHGLAVSSRWFRITVDVHIAATRLRLVSDLERVRHTRRTRVIQRRMTSPAESAHE